MWGLSWTIFQPSETNRSAKRRQRYGPRVTGTFVSHRFCYVRPFVLMNRWAVRIIT